MADPLPMLTLFDKQIQLRMGQANVKKWVDDIMPLLTDDDPLGVDSFATHTLPLDRRARLRHLPEKAGRRRQDHSQAITRKSSMSGSVTIAWTKGRAWVFPNSNKRFRACSRQ